MRTFFKKKNWTSKCLTTYFTRLINILFACIACYICGFFCYIFIYVCVMYERINSKGQPDAILVLGGPGRERELYAGIATIQPAYNHSLIYCSYFDFFLLSFT